jgi:hypothetical protein
LGEVVAAAALTKLSGPAGVTCLVALPAKDNQVRLRVVPLLEIYVMGVEQR